MRRSDWAAVVAGAITGTRSTVRSTLRAGGPCADAAAESDVPEDNGRSGPPGAGPPIVQAMEATRAMRNATVVDCRVPTYSKVASSPIAPVMSRSLAVASSPRSAPMSVMLNSRGCLAGWVAAEGDDAFRAKLLGNDYHAQARRRRRA